MTNQTGGERPHLRQDAPAPGWQNEKRGDRGNRRVRTLSDLIARSERPPRLRSFCRFFFQNGHCRYGEACRFSHDSGGSLTREEALKTIPYPHFASGSRQYGERCELRHRDDGGNEGGGRGREDDRVCGICLEPPRSFGILSCCDHAFCYSCLMEWRKKGSSDVASRRVCPTCRKPSDYVVPLKYMPADETEKERLLREYRVRCSKTPCKNFKLGMNGSCIFGSDCFYAHASMNGKDIKARDKSMQQLCAQYSCTL
jgi:E3 ubiquitin-protein ligase makorin